MYVMNYYKSVLCFEADPDPTTSKLYLPPNAVLFSLFSFFLPSTPSKTYTQHSSIFSKLALKKIHNTTITNLKNVALNSLKDKAAKHVARLYMSLVEEIYVCLRSSPGLYSSSKKISQSRLRDTNHMAGYLSERVYKSFC